MTGTLKKMDTKSAHRHRGGIYYPDAHVASSLEENHMGSRSIYNRWNKVHLEAEYLREYFVNEAVTPAGKTAVEQNFLHLKCFETTFVPLLRNRYQIDAPAIMHFFRDRFICQQSPSTKKYGTPMLLENLVRQASQTHVTLASLNSNNPLALDDLKMDEVCSRMHWYDVTKEYLQMVQALQTLSSAPRSH